MKIAIVHDWLVTFAGAEKVLEQFILLYPQADIFSVIDFLPQKERKFLKNKQVGTTFIQNLPFAQKAYRTYLGLMPIAVEQLDLSAYDLVISSSHAVAKGVLTGPRQVHISYVHSPMRYAWDMQHQYLSQSGLNSGLKSLLARIVLHYMRLWDSRTSCGVDIFVANSCFIAGRINKTYRRDAFVIYPPVDVKYFEVCDEKQDYYLTASRLVPYKKIPLIVKAFSEMPDKELVIIGDGPDFDACKKLATKNVRLMGWQPDEVLKEAYRRAKGFIFAAEEDFGISPVEAQACGTPVIAYGRGGVLETVSGLPSSRPTGVFFSEQTVPSIKDAILKFEADYKLFNPQYCRDNASRFSQERFRHEFNRLVNAELQKRNHY